MKLFSGRKALSSSTFLGLGAGTAANPAPVDPAAVALVPGAAAAAAVPPAGSVQPPPTQPNSKRGSAKKSTKRAKKKEGGDGGEDDEEEDEDEDDEGDEEGDDDSDEEEMRRGSSSPACRARRRERARISAILGHPSAARNSDFALHVALNMDLGRSAACALLDRAPIGTPAPSAAAPPAAATLAGRLEAFRGIAAPPGAQASEQQVREGIMSDAFAKHAVTAKSAQSARNQ